ncbi:MAG TPA: DUF2004 domain-containing protein [Polyangiaceae bacterium]|nr:DUF2004 domain-containing protein [Polyangiaceae bacterium]
MSTFEHPLFGPIDLASAGEWEGTLTFVGAEIDVDLTLDQSSTAEPVLLARVNLLDKLSLFDKMARVAMVDEMAEGEESASGLYAVHHAEELPEAEWKKIFGSAPEETTEEAFLAQLRLDRVGLYPGDAERCLVLDYTLPGEVTNYVLCVSIDANGQIEAIDMES